jgi:hypothetical protein
MNKSTLIYFGNGKLEIFHVYMGSSLSQSEHPSFSAHSLYLGTTSDGHLFRNLLQVDIFCEIHLSAVNFQDIRTRLKRRLWKKYLSVDPARSQKCRIKRI